ncbi:MAG: uL13 family ribosomal protein, partial [Spirochaetales bacterium]
MKTIFPKTQDVERKWYVVDAEGEILGRLATKVATILRGKHKPEFAPNQ